ncbi:MAG: hypothetical protein ACK47B_12000 [Armatimonadota bacterium]
MGSDTEEELIRRIKTLSEQVWEGRCKSPDMGEWLRNFTGRHCGSAEVEHLHALHLLAHVSYFGLRELRILLRAMYRELFRYPIVQQIRSDLGGSRDAASIHRVYSDELKSTRFVGMGNPAESGTHLLYYFRQENQLPRKCFASQHELLNAGITDAKVDFSDPGLKRVVFIDDLCGSGDQAVRYSRTLLKDLRTIAVRRGRELQFQYLVLFGAVPGLERAATSTEFDIVKAVNELDESCQVYATNSRLFRKPPPGIDAALSHELASGYGEELWPEHPLGFSNGQLLLAFHHNVPDNSLPILWHDDETPPWNPIFPRQPKLD